jgi:hypothetical protein
MGSAMRDRRYEAVALFELVSAFEQDVAIGRDDTLESLPDRAVAPRGEWARG